MKKLFAVMLLAQLPLFSNTAIYKEILWLEMMHNRHKAKECETTDIEAYYYFTGKADAFCEAFCFSNLYLYDDLLDNLQETKQLMENTCEKNEQNKNVCKRTVCN